MYGSMDTLHGGFRLQPEVLKHTLSGTNATYSPWGAYFAEYAGYLFMGVGNHLRIIRRDSTTGAIQITSECSFNINNTQYGWDHSWFDTTLADPGFPFETDGTSAGTNGGTNVRIKPSHRITGMCIFGEYLAFTILDEIGIIDRDRRDAEGKVVAPAAGVPNMTTPTGLYLLNLRWLENNVPTGTQRFPVACSGYYLYIITPDPAEPSTTKIERYTHKYEATGCAVFNGLLYFWAADSVVYTNGVVGYDTLTGAAGLTPDSEYTKYWGWFAARIPSCTLTNTLLFQKTDTQSAVAEYITNIVSLQGSTLGESVTYVATTPRAVHAADRGYVRDDGAVGQHELVEWAGLRSAQWRCLLHGG